MAERRVRRRGIRVEVTAAATVGVFVVLVLVAVVLLARQRDGLVGQLDDTLGVDADRIAAELATDATSEPIAGDDRLIVVERPDGAVDVSIDGERQDDLDGLRDVVGDDDERDARIGDERWRIATADDDDGGSIVHVGAPLEDVDDSVAELRRTLLWIVPLATAVLAALVWVVAGRTLRPVARIRQRVESIGGADLDQRVPVPETGDEIARLAETMNAMLGRLERSAQRQQRFVADAAHELRTPLTRMRAELEVDAHDPAHADPDATRASQLDEIRVLQRLIDDLLLLARSDRDAPPVRHVVVDLDDVVLDEARAAQQSADAIVVDTSRVSAAQVGGDPGQLRRAVRNVLDNATRHARGAVTVELHERGPVAELVIADDGPGIPPDRSTEIFERFARLDESRTGSSGGTGLGLAIVRDIVRRHGGEVVVDAAPAGGARFTITLPLDAPA
ncbi:MAG: ATP-binding protein [Ilumatobacteraceae bacterium]